MKFILTILAALTFTSILFCDDHIPISSVGVHHIVLIDLNDISDDQLNEISSDAVSLLSKIPGVEEITFGPKARDNRDVHIKDYDLALYVKFRKITDLDIYATHELHLNFLKKHKSKFNGIRVIDFYAK